MHLRKVLMLSFFAVCPIAHAQYAADDFGGGPTLVDPNNPYAVPPTGYVNPGYSGGGYSGYQSSYSAGGYSSSYQSYSYSSSYGYGGLGGGYIVAPRVVAPGFGVSVYAGPRYVPLAPRYYHYRQGYRLFGRPYVRETIRW